MPKLIPCSGEDFHDEPVVKKFQPYIKISERISSTLIILYFIIVEVLLTGIAPRYVSLLVVGCSMFDVRCSFPAPRYFRPSADGRKLGYLATIQGHRVRAKMIGSASLQLRKVIECERSERIEMIEDDRRFDAFRC
jgi:hypothetical protein